MFSFRIFASNLLLLILHVGIIHLTEDEDKLTPWWFFLSYVKTLVQSVALLKKTKAQWLLGEICLFKKYLETLAYGYDLSGVNKVQREFYDLIISWVFWHLRIYQLPNPQTFIHTFVYFLATPKLTISRITIYLKENCLTYHFSFLLTVVNDLI